MTAATPESILPELPPENASRSEVHAHLRSLLHSYGPGGYGKSPVQGPVYLAAIQTTTELLVAHDIRVAIEGADKHAGRLTKWVIAFTGLLVLATVALVYATLKLVQATQALGNA